MARHSLKKEKGAAIIVALFVVALVATAASAMIMRQTIDIRRTDLTLRHNQAELYAEGSVDWAIDQLYNDIKQQKTRQSSLKTPLASTVDVIHGYKIVSTIEDAQGRFNLNNLASPDDIGNFIRLVHTINPEIPMEHINTITAAIVDWITPGGNTDLETYYNKQTPPYAAPHRPMVSVSELRLVKGMTPALYHQLLPYIIALPIITPVNVNNASIPVLISLSPNLTAESAAAIYRFVNDKPVTKMQDFTNFDVVKNNPLPDKEITLISNYFLVKTNVTVDQQEIEIDTLLAKKTKDNRSIITVLWQTKGTL